jgi:hypothetical protein
VTLLTALESAAIIGVRPHEFYALYHSSQLPEPAVNIWFPLWRREDIEAWQRENEQAGLTQAGARGII